MKKRLKLRPWAKISLISIIVLTTAIMLVNTSRVMANTVEAHNNHLVQEYISCLENNFVQRDYCARAIGSDYRFMDQELTKRGYSYEQVGQDLYLVYPQK